MRAEPVFPILVVATMVHIVRIAPLDTVVLAVAAHSDADERRPVVRVVRRLRQDEH